MKIVSFAVMAFLLSFATAGAQDAPNFMNETYPDYALDEALGLLGALEGGDAAIDAKTMQLVQLGVSAQIPCAYCVYFHTKAAMAAGASENEVRAAVAAAADVRMWSTVLNGMGYDLDAFKAEVDTLIPTN